MERNLTSGELFGFCGEVIPLRLLGGEPYSKEKIEWRCSDDKTVQITSFRDHRSGGFTDGVLLTLMRSGEATVTATFEGKDYPCRVQVRPLHHAESGEPMQYYRGDMHDHTWDNHRTEDFTTRPPEHYPINSCLKRLEEDGRYDFAVLSDHAGLLNAREFYRGFADVDALGSENIYFPGFEGQVTQTPADRYGIERMHGGEVLCFHASDYFDTDSWDAMFELLKGSPFAFCGFAHPQIVGYSVRGIWDFRVRENNSRRFLERFRFVEMGNGTTRESNLINEYFYSEALDNGFRVSPTCSSDCHGPQWNYDDFPGKTIIMAPEKSKEAFYDAIMSNRFYASSSGNVKVFYIVNGQAAPATLNREGVYTFRVALSYFNEGDTDTHIQRCKVISDRGQCLLELENMGDHFEFTLSAPKVHYFYLSLSDKKGLKTWSCPVWTGRQFRKKKPKALSPLAKTGLRVFDRVSGQEVPELINDDPLCRCALGQPTADLLFDLGQEQEISALSHSPCFLRHSILKQEGRKVHDAMKEFPARFRISVSIDGVHYRQVASGQFRLFGGEEFIPFRAQRARYLRLEILSTIGKESERTELADAPLTLTEITLWR